MSKEFCIRINVSISTPKAFSKRMAISPERSAFAFSKLDRVGRDTRSAFAASVTDSPALRPPLLAKTHRDELASTSASS
jgi:hypothetical protein